MVLSRCELVFEKCFVPEENVLGQEGKGLAMIHPHNYFQLIQIISFMSFIVWMLLERLLLFGLVFNYYEKLLPLHITWPWQCYLPFSFRSLRHDVRVRFGEACFSSWTPGYHAGMSWCCPSVRSPERAVRPPNWGISVYTGFIIVTYWTYCWCLMSNLALIQLVDSAITGENCWHVYFFTIIKVYDFWYPM